MVWGRNVNFRCTKQIWGSLWSWLTRGGGPELWTSSVCWWSDSRPAALDKWSLTISATPPRCSVFGVDEASETVATPSLSSTPTPTTVISPPALFATISEPCSVSASLSNCKQRALARGLHFWITITFLLCSLLHFILCLIPSSYQEICDNGGHVGSLVQNSH